VIRVCQSSEITPRSNGLQELGSLVNHRSAIPLGGPAGEFFLPIITSIPLAGEPMDAIEHALIFVHGEGADAERYFCLAISGQHEASKKGARSTGGGQRTLVIAPWFGNQSLTLNDWLGSSPLYGGPVGVSPTATSVAWPRSEGKRNWHVLPAHVGRKQIGAESGGGLPQETVDGYEPYTIIAWQAITSPGRGRH
jgi:hypothetical protein